MKITPYLAKIGKQFGILLALLLVLIAIVYCSSRLLLGSVRDSLISHAAPAVSYEEAVARFEKFQSRDGLTMNPEGRSILLTLAHRTDKFVVFFPGFHNA